MTKQQARLRVRLYARLSKDDGDADKESNSITNQLQMLRYYSKEKGFEIIDEYVDDGYSGTTFNRPDLNRMIEDAMEDTQPSGIMVKDMSRFGRNNAMFMYYVEEIFPNNDILFIALNDDVDTRYEDNEMMPFKSIMNEYYARDTSKKIRSVKKTTALSGGFCGSFAPYGYRVDPNNKRKLLIDPETAPIVKRIFEMSKQGNSVHQIARTLCEEKILIPRAYRAMKNGTLETSTGFRFPTDWVGKNVKMILENQVYLGHMVSHKTQTKSFKNRKLVAVPKEDWIVVKNTHEAIIDEETFELVQKFISVKKRYAILVREEFSCLEFIMNRDTINWILKKLNTGGRIWSIYQRKSIKTASATRWWETTTSPIWSCRRKAAPLGGGAGCTRRFCKNTGPASTMHCFCRKNSGHILLT